MKGLDLLDMAHGTEEAFIAFESMTQEQLEIDRKYDRDNSDNFDRDHNYIGSYEPERHYVQAILAFIDEYDIKLDVKNITEYKGHDFPRIFSEFKSKVHYTKTRFLLRQKREATGQAGTLISIGASFKTEIHSHLDIIRKIVNQEITDQNKKDAIFRGIASLASEVDRDRTTLDAAFSRFIDLSKVIREFAGNIEPAVTQLERIMSAFTSGVIKIEILTVSDRPKLIEDKSPKPLIPIDDEIPF
ncbi:MAG TPA: hypothetical protein VHP58_04265 [Alphaproteobacteria bacterium]|nr:hypothetical protein [Alphaproteobacteria bacterium]